MYAVSYHAADLLARIQEQQAVIDELSVSHLGILSPAAIRRALRLMAGPVDLICIDFRKLHDLNDLLGYDVANVYFGRFARTRQHDDTGRPADTRGQYGGDEIVIACAPGDGQGLLSRLVQALDELTQELTPAQRDAMAERTGGLIDGFCAAFVLIEGSHYPLIDATRGITQCGALKAGPVTQSRSTSGKAGTIIGGLAPLAYDPPSPDPNPLGGEEGDSLPRSVTRQSQAIEARISVCPNCQGIHHVQACPELRGHVRASEADWRIAVGRKLCAMRWRDYRAFVALLLSTPIEQLTIYAASYQAFIKDHNQRSDLTVNDVLKAWGRIISDSAARPSLLQRVA